MSELMNPEAMGFLERVVRDPSIDVAKLERIIELQERQASREAKRQFDDALNALQSEMPQIQKDRMNPHARSRYATYEAIDAILRPLYTKHGFSVRFSIDMQGNRIRVGCVVSRNGHSEPACELESGPDMTGTGGRQNKTEVQGIGSIVSYLKRYTVMAAFAVALQDDDDDDDGNSSRQRDEFVPVTKPVTLNRAAAADMQRAPKVTEKPETTIQRTDEQWKVWVDKLRQACAVLYSQEEFEEIGKRPSVGDAIAKGPQWVQRDVDEILADNGRRIAERQATGPEVEPLPDLEIHGADKLAG